MVKSTSKENHGFFGCFVALIVFLVSVSPGAAQSYDAFLEPNKIVDISSPFRGRLSQISVSDGDRVVAGQLLAELDTRVLKAQLASADEAAAFHGRIDSAKAKVKMQKDRYAMLIELEKSGNARPQEMTRARTDMTIARAELLSARDDQKLRGLEADIIRARIEENRLRSPVDGIVVNVSREKAELVGGADQQSFITLVQLNPLQALFHLPPAIVEKMQVGADIGVEVDGAPVIATIVFVSPVINAKSGTMDVRLTVGNKENVLTSGRRCILQDSAVEKPITQDSVVESGVSEPSSLR